MVKISVGGMSGLVDYSARAGKDKLERMCSTMLHRGKRISVLSDENCAMGVLSSRQEEAFGEPGYCDERFICFLQGEVYNIKELPGYAEAEAASVLPALPAEAALVYAYRIIGDKLLEDLDGDFALAIWDKREKSLLLARDRLGTKPLFYSFRNGVFCYASELKAILASGSAYGPDPQALYDYLSLNYVPGTQTLLKGVNSVPAGYSIKVSANGLLARRYWGFVFNSGSGSGDYDLLRSKFYALLEKSVQKRFVTGDSCFFLSGGVDSGSIAYIAKSRVLGKIYSACAGFESREYDTSYSALWLARRLGIECEPVSIDAESFKLLPEIVRISDNLCSDPSILASYLLCAKAKQRGYKNILLGDGADQMFGGLVFYPAAIANMLYRRFTPSLLKKIFESLACGLPCRDWPVGLFCRINHFLCRGAESAGSAHFLWQEAFSLAERRSFLNSAVFEPGLLEPMRHYEPFLDKVKGPQDINMLMEADVRNSFMSCLLPKSETSCMAHGIEARFPFADNALFGFSAGLSASCKIKGFKTKRIMKDAMTGKLPARVLNAPKRGFSLPLGQWMRQGPGLELINDYLNKESLSRIGFFNEKQVGSLIKLHMEGRRDCAWQLWVLLNYSLWHSIYC